MDLQLFIARLHPLIVHLPIGFLILGIVLEFLDRKSKEPGKLRRTILWVLGLSVLAGALALLTGFLLEGEGSQGGSTLQQHKILAIVTIALTALIFIIKSVKSEYPFRWSVIGSAAILALISATGHLGGVLTHGHTYLSEYAPPFIRPLLGGEAEAVIDLSELSDDSVLVYAHAIQPLLEAKCTRCHNPEETRGGLDLTQYSLLFEESETGVAVIPGKSETSELFRRVTLAPSNRKFMPPSGDQLSYTETALLKWWIAQGADSLQRFDSEAMGPELMAMVKREYGKDYYPKPYFERVKVSETDESVLAKLRTNGFQVEYLGAENYLLDVGFQEDELAAEHYNLLKEIADKVAFLDLSEASIPGEVFRLIGEMSHLTRVDLHASNVRDEDLGSMVTLEHIEALNLYGTSVTDEGLAQLQEMPSLKRVYLWKTGASDEFVAQLESARPDLQLIKGFDWN